MDGSVLFAAYIAFASRMLNHLEDSQLSQNWNAADIIELVWSETSQKISCFELPTRTVCSTISLESNDKIYATALFGCCHPGLVRRRLKGRHFEQ